MKKIYRAVAMPYFLASLALAVSPITVAAQGAGESPIDPCLACHMEETAKIVQQWQAGKHSKTGVKCYVCHFAESNDPKGMEHNNYFVVKEVSAATCKSCHPENGDELHKKYTKEDAAHP